MIEKENMILKKNKSYNEVLEVLKMISEEDYKKIPKFEIEVFEERKR